MAFKLEVSCCYPYQHLTILLKYTKIKEERVPAVIFFFFLLNTKHNNGILSDIRPKYKNQKQHKKLQGEEVNWG